MPSNYKKKNKLIGSPGVRCKIRDHSSILNSGGAVQRGLERNSFIVDHHDSGNIATGLDPLEDIVHVNIDVNISSGVGHSH